MGEEDYDQPDRFFDRTPNWRRKVVPAWNSYTSVSKVESNTPIVFFFPQHQAPDPDDNGWVNPKMYKRRMMSKKLYNRMRRTRKRAWRKMSNRLQKEWRFLRYPRDESGRVIPGIFRKRANAAYVARR